jgi:hypothetical protein
MKKLSLLLRMPELESVENAEGLISMVFDLVVGLLIGTIVVVLVVLEVVVLVVAEEVLVVDFVVARAVDESVAS